MKESIKNAFECVGQVYEEVSLLLQDFDTFLTDDGFECLHKSTIATTDLSRHIGSPRYWLARSAGRYYGLSQQQVKNPLLFISVMFADAEQKAMEPVLVLGWLGVAEQDTTSYDLWWLRGVYLDSNNQFEHRDYVNNRTGKIENLPDEIESPMMFSCKPGTESHKIPKEGVYISVPLTNVKTQEHVKALSKKLVLMWPEDFSAQDRS